MTQKRFPAKVLECRIVSTIELENGMKLELVGARLPAGTVISLIADRLKNGQDPVNYGGYEVMFRPHAEACVHPQPYLKSQLLESA
jgi:hypothetical protein